MWRKLWFDDEVERKIRHLISAGVVQYDAEKGRLVPVAQANYDTNWLFFGYTVGSRDCLLWHTIMFNVFGLVPSFCRLHCWKVVIKPRTVKELIQFYGLAQAIPYLYGFICPLHGKCGIDTRYYTNVPYDAFVYCTSKEEGLEKYEIIRDACNRYLEDGENIDVILKRSCTEFERALGPTSNSEVWDQVPPDELELERKIADIFDGLKQSSVQPDWQKNKTILHWCKFANTFGDRSYVDLFGEDILDTVHAVTYHSKGGDAQEANLVSRVCVKYDHANTSTKGGKE